MPACITVTSALCRRGSAGWQPQGPGRGLTVMCALTPAPAPAQGESWRWVLVWRDVRSGGAGAGSCFWSRDPSPALMAPWLGLLQGRGLTGKAEPSSALCSASPVPRWLGVQVTHPGTPTSPRASPLSSASAAGPVCTKWPLCHPRPALSLSLSQVSWPCPEPEHCVHSKAWARDPPTHLQ